MPLRFTAVSLCFLASGFAALLYQTAWTREFAFIFGTSDLAVVAVLAGYMGGLAIGAAVAGRWLGAFSRPLAAYALLEGSIGLLALGVPFALRGILWCTRVFFGQHETPPAADDWLVAILQGGASLAVLVLPTALMGATLPLLIRSEVENDTQVGRRVSVLYAFNTAGAVLGTVAAAFVFLPRMGLRSTVFVGVAVNLAVALLAFALSRNETPSRTGRRATIASGPHWILPLMAAAGFTSFQYEILWTRMLGQLLGGSVYGFATMLAAVLSGIALGSFAAGRFASDSSRALRAWIACEIFVALAALGSFVALGEVPSWTADLARSDWTREFGALVAAATLLPTTIFIGATYPLAVRVATAAEDEPGVVGARVYSWNTVGGIVGALVGGYWILPEFGFYGTLAAMVVLNAGLAVAAAMVTDRGRALAGGALACIAVFLVLGPVGEPWKVLTYSTITKKTATDPVEFFEVGRSTNVLVLDGALGSRLITGGLPEATVFDVDDMQRAITAKWLGALPALARPETRSLLVVGLGGGIALRAIPESVERVDVIELEDAVVRANRVMARTRPYDPGSDPRIRVIVNDARGALVRTAFRYDAIVSQPSHPWTAGASHLYTRDFFQLAEDHLSENGVFVQWIGPAFVDADLLKSLLSSLRDVFDFVRVFRPFPGNVPLFIASNAPLPVEETAPAMLRDHGDVVRYAGIFSVEDIALSAMLLEDEVDAFASGAPIITDDYNLMQMRSPLVFETSLANRPDASVDDLDPLAKGRIAAPLDAEFALRRLAAENPRRARRLMREYPWETQAAHARATAIVADWNEGPRAAGRAGMRAFESGDEKGRSAALLAAILEADYRRGTVDLAEVLAHLSDAQRFVVESGLPRNRGNLSRLERHDAMLASISVQDPLFESATRLRIRWRRQSERPDRLRETLPMLGMRIALFGSVDAEVALAETFAELGDLGRSRATLVGAASRIEKAAERNAALARRVRALTERLP